MAGSNSSETGPDLQLPASEQVASAGTVAVSGASYTDSFAADNPGALYLNISDGSGLLYGFTSGGGVAAPGAGTDAISFQGSYAEVQAIINSLTYVATASGSSDAIHYDIWNQAGAETTGSVPITISGTNTSSGSGDPPGGGSSNPPRNGTNAPTLSEPANETLGAGATLAVSGSYSDSLAASNPGAMYLSITDGSGKLYASNAAGSAVAGSGSNAITLNASYADVNAILQSLSYVAGGAGTDSIHFDLWNQGGVETTDTVPVTITTGGSTNPDPTSETWTGAVNGDWNNAGNWSGGAVPTSGDSVTIPGGVTNTPTLSDATLSGETITLAGGTVDFNDVTLDSVLQASTLGSVEIGGTLTVGSTGTLEPGTAGAQLNLLGSAETIINDGTVAAGTGGNLAIYNNATGTAAAASLLNNGTILADGGTVNLASHATYWLPGSLPGWTVSNAGGIGIGDQGNLMLDGTVAGGDIAMSGSSGLSLEQPNAMTGGAAVSGFGPGEQIDLYGAAGYGGTLSFANGTLDVSNSGGTLEQSIALGGSFTTGNFEQHIVGGYGNPGEIVVVPSGGTSGMFSPEIAAPASATVAQGGTLALNDVTLESVGSGGGNLLITADSGTLYMNGGSGSGTQEIMASTTSTAQLQADMSSLTYVPAAAASADTVAITVSPPAPVSTTREIPISIGNGGTTSGPGLHEPASETVAAGGTVAVSGSYSDSFAAGNAGDLYLGISDSTGTLTATNAAGQAVAGSGSHSISVQADYVDVNAILASLHYGAGSSSGADTINFDIWNQAGTETTGATAVTIAPASQGAAMTAADFAPASAGTPVVPPGNSGSSGSMMLADTAAHPIGVPLPMTS